jgi:hypothetical protein
MARGTGAKTRMLLIGTCVFGAGYGSGQVVVPASAETILPTVSLPVPTGTVPVPTVSPPATPTVPTLPNPGGLPPTASVPLPEGPRPPVAETPGGSQMPPVHRARPPQSPSTVSRVQSAPVGGGRRTRATPDRRHTAILGSGAARATRRRVTPPRAVVSTAQLRAPASSRTSSPRAQHSDRRSSNPLDTIGRHLPLPIPVPDWSKPIIGVLLLVAIWLGVRSRLAATRATRLERQDQVLLHDVDTMQTALVPQVPARLEGLAVSVAYRPADGPAAGGDFYDVFVPRPGKVAIVLGDVCGHGREAVTHAALTRYTLRAYLQAGLEPRAALALAGHVLADPRGFRYATVVLAVYDAQSGTLTYANAGHPQPITFGFRPRPQPTSCASPPIGWGVPTGRRQTKISLPAGGEVCFFSDGLTDARRAGEPLGRERLVEILHSLGPRPDAAQLLEEVRAESETTPDDMAACILAPEAVGEGIYTHVEELEADAGALSGARVQGFLEECSPPAIEIAHALERARAIVAEFDTAVLAVHLAPTSATVIVSPPEPGPREAALGQHQEPGVALLQRRPEPESSLGGVDQTRHGTGLRWRAAGREQPC